MERGAKAVIYILLFALVCGAVVVAVHPDYRESLKAVWSGQPEKAPLWISNQDYYPNVQLPIQEREGVDAE